MRRALLIVWLLIPVTAGAYHFGPGQDRMLLDEVENLVSQAQAHVEKAQAIAAAEDDFEARDEWTEADRLFTEAIDRLPTDRVAQQRELRLERNKVRMHISKLPSANADLKMLVEELEQDSSVEPSLLSEARKALASSQYYMTWLMRLEGAPRQEWEPEIDAARQTYKLLAESARTDGNAKALEENKQNLESAIRLARMDLTELQGLPIPSQ